jgi:2-phospho-L-lactate/phosphoenolpyruvate guanylyltransferase
MSPSEVAALQCLGVHVAVLVPVKRFSAAKGRLIGTVGDHDRARFARWMASGVIGAVREFPTFIACDDDEVAEWAEHHGAQVIWGEGLGLNGAVDDGIEQIVKHDVDHIIVAHADLPRPANITTVARPGCITLVPDRRRDGTNVMSFPARTPLRASYGGGSFGRHLAQALELAGVDIRSPKLSGHALPRGAGGDTFGDRVSVEVRSDPDLSLDLDTPADLNHPLIREVLPEWLRTNLANRRSSPQF